MPRVARSFDVDDMVIRYQSGESEKKLAEYFGVSRNVIASRLENAGIVRRSIKEATQTFLAQASPEYLKNRVKGANAAIRGSTQTEEHRAKIASFYERNPTAKTSFLERAISEELTKLGVVFTPQKAVGRYNVDIALTEQSIALEIFGGHWHASGSHATSFERRSKYLFDSGWTIIVCWVSFTSSEFIPSAIADYAIGLQEILSRNPSSRCKHYVIRGDGKPSTMFRTYLKYIT